jgi:hypothetical protein
MAKTRQPSFEECLAMMREGNPQVAEAGYGVLAPRVKKLLPRLIAAFETEDGHGTKCWLLQLIGEARSEAAFDCWKREAQSDDGAIRSWAVRGLTKLDTQPSRDFLFQIALASLNEA